MTENITIAVWSDKFSRHSVFFFFFFLLVCLVGFLTFWSTTGLYRGRAPRQSVLQFYVLPRMRQSGQTMTSVSAGHIILTPQDTLSHHVKFYKLLRCYGSVNA